MDPLSQAVTGAALAGIFCKKPKIRAALLLGACAGMAPDLDIFIRSVTDPLMALEYHRHFTHSLAFSPIGGLLVATVFWLLPWIRKHLSFKQTWLFSFLGVVTHGALDSCTGYGTHLLWPFSNLRESWNIIGIIDPFYTLPALGLVIAASIRKSWDNAMAATLWMCAYLMLGTWQHHRATNIATEWLDQQSTEYTKLTLRPTIGNLWLWRILYRDVTTNRWQTNALHIPYWSGKVSIKRGASATILSKDIFEDYPKDSVAGADLRRFEFFSADYLSRHDRPDGTYYIGDIRYSMTPNSAQPLWGIEMPKNDDQHVIRHASLRKKANWEYVLKQLKGENFTPIN
ncbi:MAG: metal-dependent hydrolase [Rickettsiales bacterium]|nr:metal-dependent hydrolase [Rickettsiales bacterium]